MQQYYGHPANRFWPLLTQLLGYQSVPATYEGKKQMLLDNHIALWDVIGSCQRQGSLDTAIKSEQPNDIEGFLKQHPNLRIICCNGKKAASVFKKYTKSIQLGSIKVCCLPSTSPANAGWRLPMLIQSWHPIKEVLTQIKNPEY